MPLVLAAWPAALVLGLVIGAITMLIVGLAQCRLGASDIKLAILNSAETSAMIFMILLGAVMDELAMILLTLPVFFPIVQALDFGMPPDEVAIWFGILVLIVVGIGLVAPPIGLNVLVVQGIAGDVPIQAIYRGILPYLVADVIRLGLCLAFPGIALWLVRLLN